MAGKSDYVKAKQREDTRDEREKALAEKTKLKLWKENIKASELAAYLSYYSRNKVHFDRAKVIDRIEEICQLSGGLLEINDFKRKPITDKSPYIFPPEIHGLLLVLLDCEYFDNRKNNRKLSTRETLYHDLTVNVELYLNDTDKGVVLSNPAFANAKCESMLSEAINGKMHQLIRDAMHADEVIRLKLLKRIYDELSDLVDRNQAESRHIFCSKMVYKHTFTGGQDEDYLMALFEADTLVKFIVDLLAIRLKGKAYKTLAESEKIKYTALYAQAAEQAMEDALWVELGDNSPEQVLEDIKNKAIDDTKYKDLLLKAQKLFDMQDSEELQLYHDLICILQMRFIAKNTTADVIGISKKFYEAAFSKSIYDLLGEFSNFNSDTLILQELRRINQVTKLRRNNQETEN